MSAMATSRRAIPSCGTAYAPPIDVFTVAFSLTGLVLGKVVGNMLVSLEDLIILTCQ